MRLLLEMPEDYPGAQFIAYRLSRLVNLWLADLPHEILSALLDREARTLPENPAVVWPVRYDGFKIDYLADHFFSVRFGRAKVRIHDVWRFFGVPLDEALATWKVDDLAGLMDAFRAGCIDVGVVPRAWEGPGSGASVLLERWGIKDHLAIRHPATPDGVLSAARFAYFAHRFEAIQPGEHPRAWHWDIRRAYPWAACQIPDWTRGTWQETGDQLPAEITPASLFHLSWCCPRSPSLAFGPFPWRYGSGELCYPLEGQNWVWGAELAAAVAIWGPECFQVHAGWCFTPDDASSSPWAPSRAIWPLAAGFPPLKKMLNACPGKLAQAHPRPGPYFDPVSAGLVTSVVRARILELMGQARGALVAVLGDGLITARPMPWPTGELPGELSGKGMMDLLMVQPSIYFVGDQVGASGDGAHAFADADAAFWSAWRESGMAGQVEIPFRHQTSIAEGLTSGSRIGEWVEASQVIGFAQARRRMPGPYRQDSATGAVCNLTRPLVVPDDLVILRDSRGHLRGYDARGWDDTDATPSELMGDHSTPFWGQDFRPISPPVASWPGSGDDL